MGDKTIKHLSFGKDGFQLLGLDYLRDISLVDGNMNWINISLDNSQAVDDLEEMFNISPSVIEDIKDTSLLPKIEDYRDYLFMMVEDINYDDKGGLQTKQLSLILFKDMIISVEEDLSIKIEGISSRIKDRIDILDNPIDNIFYELVDEVVEDYFNVLEEIGEKIDSVEDRLLIDPRKETLNQVYKLKRELISIRKTLWLMRNAINRLIKNEIKLVDKKTINYFWETYDDIVQLIDLTETYRDICSGMLDIYLSSISNKTNEIVKVLTILSTIFIPLTFLAGVYGMNFKHFPEIQWKYGYLGFWLLSLLIIGLMIRFFKRKKWL